MPVGHLDIFRYFSQFFGSLGSVNRKRKMNDSDISGLSYKELQTLASRYQVPGNIKKSLLVRILQAVTSGNQEEVSKLLTDLKKTRKRKIKKSKPSRHFFSSTPLHSPEYSANFVQKQQASHCWISVEKNIGSEEAMYQEKDTSQYTELRHFLFHRLQREYQACDSNNNIPGTSRQDLRSSRLNQKSPKKSSSKRLKAYSKRNEQTSKSMLLKKMLQAPVGANLEEIATPVSYRHSWLPAQYSTSNEMEDENSDTLTAESESNVDEIIDWEGYRYNNLMQGNFVNLQHMQSTFSNDHFGQLQYQNLNSQENCRSWIASNPLENSSDNVLDLEAHNRKTCYSVYCESTQTPYFSMEGNTMPFPQYTENNNLAVLAYTQDPLAQPDTVFSGLQTHPINSYYSQQSQNQSQNNVQENYFCSAAGGIYGLQDQQIFPVQQDTNFADCSQSSFVSLQSTNPYNCELHYEQPTGNENVMKSTYTVLEDTKQIPASFFSGSSLDTSAKQTQNDIVITLSNEVLHPYWPKWQRTESPQQLENILNLSSQSNTDCSTTAQTSCVYCLKTPLVSDTTDAPNLNITSTRGFTVEDRQHSFTTNSLLYDESKVPEVQNNEETHLETLSVEKISTNCNSEEQQNNERNGELFNYFLIQDDREYSFINENDEVVIPDTAAILMPMSTYC